MPYKRIGKTIFVRRGEKWVKKLTAKTQEKAKKALKLLYGIEGGWKPTGKKPIRKVNKVKGQRK